MSWVDQIHKKQRANRQARQILNSETYKARMQEANEENMNRALDCFLLLTIDYLVRNFRCGQNGVLKFIDFVVYQFGFVEKDDTYFKTLNEELKDEIGVDILENLKFKRNPKQ